jgi:HPt (histidine-containing phosphotransfer) domain-containing protein
MHMTAIAHSLREAIVSLRERFLSGLPARIDGIAAALQAGAASEAEHEFHNLAGTAATYGLYGIAAVAAEGEEGCTKGLDEVTRRRVAGLLDQLRVISRSWQPNIFVIEDDALEGESAT